MAENVKEDNYGNLGDAMPTFITLVLVPSPYGYVSFVEYFCHSLI